MKIKSRSVIAWITIASFSAISLSACATQTRYRPQSFGTRYQGQSISDNRGGLLRNNAGTNNGMQLGVTPGTSSRLGTNPRLGISPRIGTGTGNNNMRLGYNDPSPISPALTNVQLSNKVKNGLNTMTQIKKVNVIVMGNTALVAYNRSNTRDDINATRKIVVDKVKSLDRSITNVYTTESPSVAAQVTRLYNSMVNNEPMNGLRDGFNRLVNNIRTAGGTIR